MKRIDLFTLKCWLAILMAYLEREERQQNDKFTWHDGDVVVLAANAQPAEEEERWALAL